MVLYFQVLLLHHQPKSRHLRYQEVQKMRRMPSWYVNSTTDCDDEESKRLFLSQLSNSMFLLPTTNDVKITSFRLGEEEGQFYAVLRLNIFSKADVFTWLENLKQQSMITLTSRKTYEENTSKIVFKVIKY